MNTSLLYVCVCVWEESMLKNTIFAMMACSIYAYIKGTLLSCIWQLDAEISLLSMELVSDLCLCLWDINVFSTWIFAYIFHMDNMHRNVYYTST